MSHRIEQINELLKSELANLISRNIPMDNGLITVTFVKCSPDLKIAKIGVSILPNNMESRALHKLRQNRTEFTNELRKKLNLKFIPKLNWIIDDAQKHVEKIENILKDINV